MESRGRLSSRFGPDPVCSSMIVSVRPPPASPVASSSRSSLDRSARESLPTRRYVVPGWSAGRSPPGSKATWSMPLNAWIGVAMTKSSQTSSSTKT